MLVLTFLLLPWAWAQGAGAAGAASQASTVKTTFQPGNLDIPLDGACRPEILYHCSHVLSSHQKLSALKTRTESAAAAAAVAAAAVQHVAQKIDSLQAGGNKANAAIEAAAGAAKSAAAGAIGKSGTIHKGDTARTASSKQAAGAGSKAGVAAAAEKLAGDAEHGTDAAAWARLQNAAKLAALQGGKATGPKPPRKIVGSVDSKDEDEAFGGKNGIMAADLDEGDPAVKDHADMSQAAGGAAGHDDVTQAVQDAANAARHEEEHDEHEAQLTREERADTTTTGTGAIAVDASKVKFKTGKPKGDASAGAGATAAGSKVADGEEEAAVDAAEEEEEELNEVEKEEVDAATEAATWGTATKTGAGTATGAKAAAAGTAARDAAANQKAVDPLADNTADINYEDGADTHVVGAAGDDDAAAGGGGEDQEGAEVEEEVESDNVISVDGGADEAARRMARRKLLGQAQDTGVITGEREFHKHESSTIKDSQEFVTLALTALGINANMPAAELVAANAPVARCLRQAMREELMSISPDIPTLSDECKAEVREFYIERAADVRHDLPLVAACATDIVGVCKGVTDADKVLGCLRAHKASLKPLCKLTVTQRQVDMAEDIALDPVLDAACSGDRERLCPDAGWGDGAAQACLEYHLHGESLGGAAAGGIQDDADASHRLGLSPPCATALFQREVEASQDIRFNYRLSAACAGAKNIFCRDVRPGTGEVLRCLSHHTQEAGFSESCKAALDYNAQLRASDVRLDFRFRLVCSRDVSSLCFEEEVKILNSTEDAPGEGARVLECMRRSLGRIRTPECAAHVSGLMAAAYRDSRLDTHLLTRCDADVERLCYDRATALTCLKASIAKHEAVEPECLEAVKERDRQAAGSIDFLPALKDACSAEVHTFCGADHIKGPMVIDCLADNRHEPEFSAVCRTALVSYLADAVSDVRTLHSLKQDCADDITRLCNTTQPGQGRVLSCLQQARADITGDACKKQMLRLLGLVVEDVRFDFRVSQACKADVQQFCAGIKVDGSDAGAVHECLRKSREHLSPACKEAEAAVEKLEHEDVRLNPKIQKECPLAISQFCADVPPGNANVMSCLQQSSSKASFPDGCARVITTLLERSSLKYSLNTKLKAKCDPDVARLCKGAQDEPIKATDPSILGCLASSSAELGTGCRSELAALVRVHLNRYRIGMPLTSPCDGDVLARCNVDKQVTPFLLGGYIQSCLSKNADKIHRPCWSLLSMFDERQYTVATTLEAKHWTPELQQEALNKVTAEVTEKVVAEVRRELEPKIIDNLHNKVNTALEAHSSRIKPLFFALINAVSLVLAVLVVLGLMLWFVWSKYLRRGAQGGRTVAIKDGRV